MRTFDQVKSRLAGRSNGAFCIFWPPVPHKDSRVYTNKVGGLLSHSTDNSCG